MKPAKYTKESKLNSPAATVFAWHEDPSALEELTPKEEGIQIVKPSTLVDGAEVYLRVPVLGRWVYVDWVSQLKDIKPGLEFSDTQTKGIFKLWHHRHRFIPDGNGCLMRDEIEFILPGGVLIHSLFKGFVLTKLNQVFTYRHKKLSKIFGDLSGNQGLLNESNSRVSLHPHNPILEYADET